MRRGLLRGVPSPAHCHCGRPSNGQNFRPQPYDVDVSPRKQERYRWLVYGGKRMQRHLIALSGALSLLVGQAVLPLPAQAQEKSCTQIASNARNWLVQNPSSRAYTNADVDRAFKECLKTGYWTNVSKSGGQPATKR